VEDKKQSPEVIEKKIQDTRESLTDKVALLEQTVVGTIQNATDAVQDTVTTVKSAVQDSVEAVKDSVQESVTSVTDSVKETLDFAQHVRQHPWPMMAGAAFAGMAVGWLIYPRRHTPTVAAPRTAYTPAAASSEPREPGMLDAMMGKVGHEVQGLVASALDTTFATLREQVRDNWPKVVATLFTAATDHVAQATSLGTPETPARFGNHRGVSYPVA